MFCQKSGQLCLQQRWQEYCPSYSLFLDDGLFLEKRTEKDKKNVLKKKKSLCYVQKLALGGLSD